MSALEPRLRLHALLEVPDRLAHLPLAQEHLPELVVRSRVARIAGEQALEARDRLVALLTERIYRAQGEKGVGMRGIQLDRLLEVADRPFRVAEPAKALAEEEPRRGVAGLPRQCREEHAGRIAVLPQVHEGPAEVLASVGATGIEPHRLGQLAGGVGIAFGGQIREAEVVAEAGVARREARGPLQLGGGPRRVLHQAVGDAEEVVALRGVRLHLHGLAQVLDRLRKASLGRIRLSEREHQRQYGRAPHQRGVVAPPAGPRRETIPLPSSITIA